MAMEFQEKMLLRFTDLQNSNQINIRSLLTKTTVFIYCQTCFIISFLVEEGKYEKIGNEKILIGIKISTDFLLTEDGEPVNFTSFKNRKKRSPEGLEGNKITVVEFQAAYSFYPPFFTLSLIIRPNM